MTVKFQLSDKRGDAILLVSAEDSDPGAAYQSFRIAAEDAGLNPVVEAFSQPGVVGQAIAAATAITAPAPAAYAAPAAVPGAPVCPHGAMTRRTGTNARGAWVGYFCPSPKGTPDQCKARFE
jgi:hypothetical protein